MEYLTLVGGDLRSHVSEVLGTTAPFFWSVIAPVFLAAVWIWALYALLQSWFGRSENGERGGSLPGKLFMTVFLLLVMVSAGTAFETLVLENPQVHSRLLATVLGLLKVG
jgi:hypothetical protein